MENKLEPHTRIYQPEYGIKNDDGTTFYHRPNIYIKSNGDIKVQMDNCYQVGVKQTKELLKKISKTLESLTL